MGSGRVHQCVTRSFTLSGISFGNSSPNLQLLLIDHDTYPPWIVFVYIRRYETDVKSATPSPRDAQAVEVLTGNFQDFKDPPEEETILLHD